MRAITFDCWDTLYDSSALPAPTERRKASGSPATPDAPDGALLMLPPRLLPGAADALRALSHRTSLVFLSDEMTASMRAQDRLLEKDAIRACFAATVYGGDEKENRFHAAARALGISPDDMVHVGNREDADVREALAAGVRAVRLDVALRSWGWGGPSKAEFVARSFEELRAYLERELDRGAARRTAP